MQSPLIFLIGLPHHGKTTSRKIVQQITNLPGASCSDVIHAFISLRRKITVAEWRAVDKEERRPVEIEAGNYLVGSIGKMEELPVDDSIDEQFYRIPSGIIRVLFHSGVRVIDGVRRKLELHHARAHLDWCGVKQLVIWIERPGVPLVPDSTDLQQSDADEVILNDGDEAQLRARLHEVLKRHEPKTPKLAERAQPEIVLKAPKSILLGR